MNIREAALERSVEYFDTGSFESDLAELVAMPSESQETRGSEHLRNYLDFGIIPMLLEMGFECNILQNPIPGAGPLLLAERIESADLPTILTFGHGDVVRGQEHQWREGLLPFKLIEEGERLYGRGSGEE